MNFTEFYHSTGKRLFINWQNTSKNHNSANSETRNYGLEIRFRDAYYLDGELQEWFFTPYLRIIYDINIITNDYGLNPSDFDSYPFIIESSDGVTWTLTGVDETFWINNFRMFGKLQSIYPNNEVTAETLMDTIASEHFTFDDADEYWESTMLSTIECVFYQYKGEKDLVNKSNYLDLYYVAGGQLTEECDILNPSILFQTEYLPNYESIFSANYVYIEKFKRYYWITKTTNVRNSLWRVDLHVDVLYSYNTDIRKQNAYVERNERNPLGTKIADDRYTFDSLPRFEFTDVTGGTLANITLNGNLLSNTLCMVFSVINEETRIDYSDISDSTGLPSINAKHRSNKMAYNYALIPSDWDSVSLKLSQQQTLTSFVFGVFIYPFAFTNLTTSTPTATIHIGTTDTAIPSGAYVKYDLSPRLIVADFTLPSYDYFYDVEPYKECQLYIPFYNNLYTFNLKKTSGHRILVFYTTQFSTGDSNVHVYDYTSGQMLLTAPVELAQKLGVTTTNAWDITIERKQSAIAGINNTMNSWFKMLSSGASGNMIGGVVGVQQFSRGIIDLSLSQDKLQDTANIQVVSANDGIYNPLKVYLITKSLIPNINDSSEFYHKNGYPVHSWDKLNIVGYEYTGYTELSQIHYTPDTQTWITTTEIDEIERLANNGIIL